MVVMLGAAVAGVSTAARRYIAAKHLESTIGAVVQVLRAVDPGLNAQALDDDLAEAVASWLTTHGHQMSAPAAKNLLAAIGQQARRDAARRQGVA